jgi:CRP-like cAMP-binding protein
MREVSGGTWLGVYDLVYRNPHSTSARTRGICEMVTIRAQDMHRLLHQYPILRNHLLPVARYGRLRTIPVLQSADDVQVTFVADSVEIKEFKSGESIYRAGSDADKIYLIDEGQVRLDRQDGAQQMWLGNGAEFGMGERLSAAPGDLYPLDHSATATTATRAFVLSRRSFFVITGKNPELVAQEQRTLRREALASVEVFRDWQEIDKIRLLGWMSHYFIPSNHLLTQQGEVVDSMWILLKGKPARVLALSARGEAIPESRVKGPAYFSEDALRRQVAASSSLEAEAGSAWLRLHWQDYRRFVDKPENRALSTRLRMPASAGGETRSDPAIAAQSETARRQRQKYEWLELGETISLITKRHWIVALWMMAPAIFFSLVAGAFAYALIAFDAGWALWGASASGWAWGWWLSLLAAFLAWIWGAYDYMNDFLIVTNTRVVRQEKVLLIRQMRQIAPLEKVQDVTISAEFWGNFWHYATVEVQTAGQSENIVFDRAANSEKVKSLIKLGADGRRGHYKAVGKREIYSALENRFGLVLQLPSRVVARTNVRETPERVDEGWLSRMQRRWRLARNLAAPDDRSRIVWHKHWIVLVWRLTLPVLAMLASLSAVVWLWPSLWAGDAIMGMVGVSVLAAFGASTFWAWYRLEDWSNDVYILDKDQLTDISRKPLAMKRIERTASLSQVVDIQVLVPSPIHYIFNFGNAVIQTAATEGNFSFDNVANPLHVAEVIRQRMDRNQQAEQKQAALLRAQELPDWLEAYSRLDPNQDSRPT